MVMVIEVSALFPPLPLPSPFSLLCRRVFQAAMQLPVTGEIDEATLATMSQPRCGMEDPFNQRTLKYRLLGEKQALPGQPCDY